MNWSRRPRFVPLVEGIKLEGILMGYVAAAPVGKQVAQAEENSGKVLGCSC